MATAHDPSANSQPAQDFTSQPSQSTAQMNLSHHLKQKRARSQLSCTPCRVGKLKCNRERPACDQCIKRSRQTSCFYVPPPVRHKPSQNVKGRIKQLENLVVGLMNQNRNFAQNPQHPQHPQHSQEQQQQQQRRHVSASTRKTAAAPAPAAGRTVPSPAFNRDDATANVHPLKPFRRPDMDHSFVGMTGGQIFHDMMLRHGVKTICKYSLSPFPRLSSCCDGEGGRRVMRLLGLGREGLGSRKSSYLYLN
jgi:hypothetical protein